MMETKADEPEHDFVLEEKVTSLLLFQTWTVRNFKLKGQSLYYDDDSGSLHLICSMVGSVTNKVDISEKEFPFCVTRQDSTELFFNAISEEVREKAISLFNFASRTGKWFYPFEEVHYKEHPTLEVIGLPITKGTSIKKTEKTQKATEKAATAEKETSETGITTDGESLLEQSEIDSHIAHELEVHKEQLRAAQNEVDYASSDYDSNHPHVMKSEEN